MSLNPLGGSSKVYQGNKEDLEVIFKSENIVRFLFYR